MHTTRIFVSSTCYDLAAVREDIRGMIIGMGHDPLLSEFSSFPVSPEEKAIANCRRNVREYSDLLVLIIGGRRGSLDPDTERPVTNLEYDEAVNCGIPVYVFISRPVQTLLHTWKKNPTVDFTPAVDYPEVFAFIQRIQDSGKWTFPFDRTDEIKEVLRGQLSGLFKDLIDRRRGGRLDPLPEFKTESKRAQQLALGKPPYWEYLLTAELLTTKLATVRRRHNDVEAGFIHQPLQWIKASELNQWLHVKSLELHAIVKRFDPAYQAVGASWGAPGVSGNPVEIKEAAIRLANFAEDVVNWELGILNIRVPEHLQRLVALLPSLRKGILEKIESIPQQINQFFVGDSKPTGTLEIIIKLDWPPIDDYLAEMERLAEIPGAFSDD